ncbi:hypothetical protein HUW51_03675 [Adhaeribacter swui]|uniref:DNA alkylation repair protein n=1 Tax=Adhaeribacter swui TaxID=2086471 RepID=A0A7G7G3X8_9BACT|nr:hypothetical protein [Adhaeribacter swui]QNF31862.1 hypothetical protein HUW51_03675 [Adhaeribacter swui]
MDPLLARLATSGTKSPDLVKQVVQEVGDNPEKFQVFMEAMLHPDTGTDLARRAAGIAEKVARWYPHLVIPYEAALLAALPQMQPAVMCWQVGLLLSYLPLTDDTLATVLNYLETWLYTDPNKFMKVHCLQAMANLSRQHDWLRQETIDLIKTEMAKGGAAVNARGRHLLKQLKA